MDAGPMMTPVYAYTWSGRMIADRPPIPYEFIDEDPQWIRDYLEALCFLEEFLK